MVGVIKVVKLVMVIGVIRGSWWSGWSELLGLADLLTNIVKAGLYSPYAEFAPEGIANWTGKAELDWKINFNF